MNPKDVLLSRPVITTRTINKKTMSQKSQKSSKKSKQSVIKQKKALLEYKQLVVMASLVLVLTLAASNIAFAQQASPESDKNRPDDIREQRDSKQGKRFGQKQSPERKAHFIALRQAVKDNDYDTWLALMKEKHPDADTLANEETFAALRQAFTLRENGEFEQAREVLKEAGIDKPDHKQNKKHRIPEAIRNAIENVDYEAWKSAVEQHPNHHNDTSIETFSILVDIHNLKEAGDHEGAKALMQQLREIRKPSTQQ